MKKKFSFFLLSHLFISFATYAENNNPKISSTEDSFSTITTEKNIEDTKKPELKKNKRWRLTIDTGLHFKPFTKKSLEKFSNITINDPFVDNKTGRYGWGESGFLFSYGFIYKRNYGINEQFFWNIRSVWIWYFPDVRYNNKGLALTLASVIPGLGKYVNTNLPNFPSWLEMLIVPVVFIDGFGYKTKNNINFSIGTVYLWGLSPAISFPITDNFEMEIRGTLFLDKLFSDGETGFHLYNIHFGVNWIL